jgi:hypothetical protein
MALLVCSIGTSVDAQWGSPEARINRVGHIFNGGGVAASVVAQSGNSEAFVAATLIFTDPYSHQRIVADTQRGDIGYLGPGSGTQEFRFNFGVGSANFYQLYVALWKRLVDISECHQGPGGGACDDCQKNGFHMEDEIHRPGPIGVAPIFSTQWIWRDF